MQMAENEYMSELLCHLFALQCRQVLCDVTLITDDGKLSAHSAVLAAASEFMCGQFQQLTRTESDKSRMEYSVHLPGCDLTTLSAALRLIYTGDVRLQDATDLRRVIAVCTSLGVNLHSLHSVIVTVDAELPVHHVGELSAVNTDSSVSDCKTVSEAAGNVTQNQTEIFVVIEQQPAPASSSSIAGCSERVVSNSPADEPSPVSDGAQQSDEALRQSTVSPSNTHACDRCGKHYRSARYLHAHQMSHRGLKPLLCDSCGRGFYGVVNLRRHILLRHDGATTLRHVCDRCGKGFVAAARLKRHITEMHDEAGRGQHCCNVCGATFANAGNLQRHVRLHSAVPRPYVCELCNRSFTQKSSLQAHGRLHDSEARRLAVCVCPVCGKQLSKSTNLHKHLRLHAPRPPPP